MANRVLPIDSVLMQLKVALSENKKAVLIAPPGAGKTTRVPLAFLHEPWLAGRKIVMLEPRRLSARSAARYMAEQLGENTGGTVGYRVKNDTSVGPKTRIEVITEGVLTRMLQTDPALSDIGMVIFDEFHERSLHADVGLALCLQSQSVFGTDMRLLLMSATMDTTSIADWLDAPIIESEGRVYPVETIYLEKPVEGKPDTVILRAIRQTLMEREGDMLVFLPGMSEIRRLEAALLEDRLSNVDIRALHGNLPYDMQDKALLPSPDGKRKIVLTTPIAETGLTVEGVRIVIDSGFMRVPRFSPKTGLTRLETVLVSRASADQRRGRAGRTSSGVCYRLWTEAEHKRLRAERTPEIEEADLASLALELAEWGASPDELSWLTPPPSAHYAQACDLLRRLGAVSESGTITEHGKKMAGAGIHPRLAHMILSAMELQMGGTACDLAALLGERDLLKGDAALNADIRLRLDLLNNRRGSIHWTDSEYAAIKRVQEDAEKLKRQFGISGKVETDTDRCGLLLSFAYPDRIASRRGGSKYLLSGGRGAELRSDQPLSREPFLVAVELDDAGTDSRIDLAAPVRLEELLTHHRQTIEETEEVEWDHAAKNVRAAKVVRLGAVILKETTIPNADKDRITQAFLQGLTAEGLHVLPWNRNSIQLRERMAAMRLFDSTWPDVSDEGLLNTLNNWLGPFVSGFRSIGDLKKAPLGDALESLLSWDQRRLLDKLAPTHIEVPSGSKIPIDYSDPTAPFIAVRLQEMFGLAETPRIMQGKQPVTIHLLSPAQRPVQITRDLASFWRDTYFEVKKDLKGRYPKHYWPDDPLQAIATNRTKPKT